MYLPSFRLEGKTAIVTGAGRGIGRSLAIGMAEAGADIAAVARTKSEIEDTANEIRKLGRRATIIVADITKQKDIDRVLSETIEYFGSCDILVNNAGMNIRKPNSFDVTEEDWEKVMDLNLRANFRLSLKVGEYMCEKKSGKIINMASIAGDMAVRTGIVYGISKAGLIQMTKYMALEWGPQGVTVNAIAPWYFITPLTKVVLENEEYKNKVLARTALPRLGEMKDIVGLAVFLASEAADFITGQTIFSDGGMRVYGFNP